MYSHYWKGKAVTANKFKRFSARCMGLFNHLPESTETAGGYYSDMKLKICGDDGVGNPVFSESEVSFNGDTKADLDCEGFYMTPEGQDDFCKTSRKPYDLLVCLCLLSAHEILGYEVTSDGGLDDWEEAVDMYMDIVYAYTSLDMKEQVELLSKVLPKFLLKDLDKKIMSS